MRPDEPSGRTLFERAQSTHLTVLITLTGGLLLYWAYNYFRYFTGEYFYLEDLFRYHNLRDLSSIILTATALYLLLRRKLPGWVILAALMVTETTRSVLTIPYLILSGVLDEAALITFLSSVTVGLVIKGITLYLLLQPDVREAVAVSASTRTTALVIGLLIGLIEIALLYTSEYY